MKTTIFLMATVFTAVAPVPGMTKWSAQYSGVTYVAVTGSTHGIDSAYIGVLCMDSQGNRLDLDQVSWTVGQTTYEVDITLPTASPEYCGSVGRGPRAIPATPRISR
jgi:hypothetical protein